MSLYIHKSHNVTVLLYHLVFPAQYRRAVFDTSVDQALRDVCLGIEALISSSSWRLAPTGTTCISWCCAHLQCHQADDDDQEPDRARDLSALSARKEAVVGR